jgi:hemerythrin-like domain-containing protein
MLRNKNLIPLSHQHQHALALCVRIDRASPIRDEDLVAWQAEIRQHFAAEIRTHFAAEEQVLFPASCRFGELAPLVADLLADHAALRAAFALAETDDMSAQDLSSFAERLSAHIRKEERQLFERMQELMPEEELAVLGERLSEALKSSAQTCVLPSQATRLRPAK